MVDARTLTREQARDAAQDHLDGARTLIPNEIPDELPGFVNSEGVYIPGYHDFEHTLWRVGADIWEILIAHPSLRKDDVLCAQIVAVATNRAAMRGRRSFILACGSVKHARYAPQLVAHLDDNAVDGQVLDTLLKMRVGEYTTEVRPLLDSPTAFIRRLAKRYVERYPDTPAP
ncbi:hypothetical protein [Microbacterium sp. NPDC089695]|uniref:hypothetical protein n=1 Tax=Microbacterium sp. NPDC089695 TaxID=3364198 RepID=UPI00380FA476